MKNFAKIFYLIIVTGYCWSFQLSAIPNPASVNCIKNDGELEIRSDDLGDYGICVWAELISCGTNGVCFDYSECEEWALYNGSCKRWQCSKVGPKRDSEGDLICYPN